MSSLHGGFTAITHADFLLRHLSQGRSFLDLDSLELPCRVSSFILRRKGISSCAAPDMFRAGSRSVVFTSKKKIQSTISKKLRDLISRSGVTLRAYAVSTNDKVRST